MNIYILYSGILHLSLFILLLINGTILTKNINKKQYYIDFIGNKETTTIQNIKEGYKNLQSEGKKHPPKINKETNNSKTTKQIDDPDYIYTNAKNIKPSMAEEKSDILTNTKISEDNSSQLDTQQSGGIRTDTNFPYPWYITKLRARIWDIWQEENISSKNLKAVVKFRITSIGKITDIKIVNSSGNRLFDQSVISTISAIKQFDPLPENFFEDYLTIYVEFKTTE